MNILEVIRTFIKSSPFFEQVFRRAFGTQIALPCRNEYALENRGFSLSLANGRHNVVRSLERDYRGCLTIIVYVT